MRTLRWSLATLAVATSALAQGPLTPPAAPAPTLKTLGQIEPRTHITNLPFTITRPGSYYLATNLIYAGGNGINIDTNDVTIDLNGFALDGAHGGFGNGIDAGLHTRNVIIRNGIVQRWGGTGVDVGTADEVLLEDLLVSSNGYRGIECGNNVRAARCTVTGNDDMGFFTFGPASVVDCSARRNGYHGFYLIGDAVIERSSSEFNFGDGISLFSGSLAVNCVARGNQTNGFLLENGSRTFNCVAIENYRDGFNAEIGCSIESCSTFENRQHGISVSNDCTVLNNHCASNGPFSVGANIKAGGIGNRIDGNTVVESDYGVWVAGYSNLVVRNTARGNNTNYFITASNSVGGIANVGGLSFTNTNPWTNFEF
jgi:hypothetical protein